MQTALSLATFLQVMHRPQISSAGIEPAVPFWWQKLLKIKIRVFECVMYKRTKLHQAAVLELCLAQKGIDSLQRVARAILDAQSFALWQS